MEVDWGQVYAAVPLLVAALIAVAVVAAVLLRGRRERGRTPGPLTMDDVRSHLNAPNLSLADKRRMARTLDGQRIRWACTFCELFGSRGNTSALCIAEPHGGQFFFDPAGADRRRLIQTPQNTRLVVEGTLRVDLDNDLLTLDAPVVRFDGG
jgi:hypothetical protein